MIDATRQANPLIGLIDTTSRLRGRLKSAFAASAADLGLSEMEVTVLNAVTGASTPPTVPRSRIGNTAQARIPRRCASSRQARVVWGSRVVTIGGDAPVRQLGHARIQLHRRHRQPEPFHQPDRHGRIARADVERPGTGWQARLRHRAFDGVERQGVADLERLIGDAVEVDAHGPAMACALHSVSRKALYNAKQMRDEGCIKETEP